MSHMWMSHVTYVNESCHTCGWFMLHMWMSHVTHVNESCHALERVVTYDTLSDPAFCDMRCYVTHMHESCHTCEWVMSHMWMSHVTHVNESSHTFEKSRDIRHNLRSCIMWYEALCHTYEWVWHINVSCHTQMIESCHTFERVMSHDTLSDPALSALCYRYGVATISRLHKIIGLICEISSLL